MPDYIKTINNLASGSEDQKEAEFLSGYEYSGDAKIDVPLTFEELLAQIPKGKMDKNLYEGYFKDIRRLRAVAEQRIAEVAEGERSSRQRAKRSGRQRVQRSKQQRANRSAVGSEFYRQL